MGSTIAGAAIFIITSWWAIRAGHWYIPVGLVVFTAVTAEVICLSSGGGLGCSAVMWMK